MANKGFLLVIEYKIKHEGILCQFNIMSCKYYCIDETMIVVTKKVNKHICLGLFFASLAAYSYIQCHFQQTISYSKSSQKGARMTEWN